MSRHDETDITKSIAPVGPGDGNGGEEI